MSNFSLGNSGENLVMELYLEKGFRMVAKNFQYYNQGIQGRLGEIDLIFEKDKHLYLIEVKVRSSLEFGPPLEQINFKKLRHLYKTFQYFLLKNKQYKSYLCQFDVATVFKGKVEIISNAYNFDGF